MVRRWQDALALLVACDGVGRDAVFRAATRSVARVLGYRYAGVGMLQDDGIVQLQCLWADGEFVEPACYPAEGTPCYTVYDEPSQVCYFDHVAERFPQDLMLQEIGARYYRGVIVEEQAGAVLSHIFAIHDGPEDPSDEAEVLLRLVAQWCSREIKIDRLIATIQGQQGRLQVALEEAERANSQHRSFLANVSHELRTPLNAIVGFSEALTMDTFAGNPDTVVSYGQCIGDSARHLLGLIEGVLDLAAIESGTVALNADPVDLAPVVRAAIDLTAQDAARAGITLGWDVPADLRAMGDAQAVRQILINLISNAIKNTRRGGRVFVMSRVSGDRVAMLVTETGVGIPQSALDRIVKPFQRVESGFVRCSEGIGLGLAIVSQLTEAMGGCIAIDSAVGVGTTVTIDLPIAPARLPDGLSQ